MLCSRPRDANMRAKPTRCNLCGLACEVKYKWHNLGGAIYGSDKAAMGRRIFASPRCEHCLGEFSRGAS
eukprot:6820765-Pyramimonas_sp.AAC.1